MEYLVGFLNETVHEFKALADCIWKFNQHIDDLEKEEIEKLTFYDEKVRILRWHHESRLLKEVFPKALNYSFVVFVYIEIETRLMRLCSILHQSLHLPIRATDLKGQGIERYFDYLGKLIGISRDKLLLLDVIRNLGKLRNCIVHTNGFLESSKDNKEIERIIDKELYLKESDRNNPKRSFKLVSIELFDGENRLRIDMHYPFLMCGYARDFFVELHNEIERTSHNK